MELNPQERASATIILRGFSITINLGVIKKVTTLLLGVQWRKERKGSNIFSKKNLFLKDEKPIKDKNRVIRESRPYPCDKVGYHIL